MAALGSKIRTLEGGRVAFMCPGCKQAHQVTVDGSRGWTFNGNGDAPTFSPSVFVNAPGPYFNPSPDVPSCHSFVTDGRIQFLPDCTHDLAGQTVDLPDFLPATA